MKIHIVKKGDSLYMIAQKYGVSLEDIVELNPSITNVDMIDVGMKIKIPASKPEDMEIMHQHEVKQGDTLWKLSKAWGVPLSDMIKANPQLKNPNVLLTGEIVNIPKTSTPGQMPHMHDEHHEDAGHHPLHPSSVMQGVQGLMGKMSTAPFIGKKPTGQKPSTMPVPTPVPTPVPMPLPEPAPAPMPVVPVMEKPKTYPIHVEYEKHIDLFQQYGVPATEVMSLYDMPNMPENVSPAMQTHGYGYPMTSPAMSGGYGHPMTSPAMSGGYGYSMPTAVSPAEMGPANWCPPGQVMGSSTLPWGAPAPMPYGPMSGYGMENEMVSPAMMMPQGGGYGQYDQTAVSPAMMMPQGG
ncbi:LysM peptidoglycan-binding domain-containing protein, partial [Paenibacillus sepulcri]